MRTSEQNLENKQSESCEYLLLPRSNTKRRDREMETFESEEGRFCVPDNVGHCADITEYIDLNHGQA